ncbi:MAG: YopX family protein [Desulfitobacterium sp.]
MREIKFRGKRVDNGEWIYGSLLDKDIISSGPVDVDEEYISLGEWCSVIPESVGQYTGLKDKNGKEIYEGDICEDARVFRFVVVWDDDNARILGRGIGKQKEYIRYVGQEPAVEVIGNIYDNLELLEV